MSLKNYLVRGTLGAVLGAAMLFAAGSPMAAEPDYATTCHNRLEADRARIDRDVAKFGPRSPAVDKDRARMDSDRSWCRNHKVDWDHSRFDIGVYIK